MKTPKIIFEDNFFMALEKPTGWHSVQLKKSNEPSIADYLQKKNPLSKNFGKNEADYGLVNRLDLETSGLILAAKSQTAWEKFHEMFSDEKIEKYYLAVLEGKLDKSISINNYIGASGRGSKKVKVFISKPAARYRALSARSDFKPIKYIPEKDSSVVQVRIHTGRRHQIRAHAKFINHPLVGDRLYGSKREGGFFLHACKYKFTHPFTGKSVTIESELKLP